MNIYNLPKIIKAIFIKFGFKHYYLAFIFLNSYIFLFPHSTSAKEVPIDITDLREIKLGRYLQYYEDKSAKLSINNILLPETSSKFVINDNLEPNFGFTKSHYWLRFSLKNTSGETLTRLLEQQFPLIDYMNVYIIRDQNVLKKLEGGDRLAFDARPIKTRNINFLIKLPPESITEIYIEAYSRGSMQFPLSLWQLDAFSTQNSNQQYLFGMYYGLILAIWIVNLMAFFSTRDIPYFFYLCYLTAFFLFQMTLNGLAYVYFWPNSPTWGNIAAPFLVGFAFCFAIQFSRSFLSLKDTSPQLDIVAKIAILFFFLQQVLALFGDYTIATKTAASASIAAAILITVFGLHSIIAKVREAKFFAIAWAIFLIGIIAHSLKTLGIVPRVFITEQSQQIGSALEVILLSFALTHRLKILKEENDKMHIRTKNLLEEKVAERTSDLQKALRTVSHELRTPIARLQMALDILRDGQQNKALSNQLSPMQDDLEEVDHLVGELLEYASMQSTQNTIKQVDFNAKEIIKELVSQLQPFTPNKHIIIEGQDAVMCKGTPRYLKRALSNLIQNAQRYASSKIVVTINCNVDASEIIVEDDGPGIPATSRLIVMQPLVQLDKQENSHLEDGGFGIGLSIVNAVMKIHSGKASIDDSPLGGALVRLHWPK